MILFYSNVNNKLHKLQPYRALLIQSHVRVLSDGEKYDHRHPIDTLTVSNFIKVCIQFHK